MPETAVPVEVAAVVEPTAAATNVSSNDVLSSLTSFFTSQNETPNETTQVEVPEVSEEEPAEVIENPDNPEEPGEEDKSEVKEGSAPAAAEEVAEEKADFDSLEATNSPTEYPDFDALKAKYPRQNKEFYVEAAKLSEEAKRGNDAIEKIGGVDYIEPLSKISSAIKSGVSQGILEGVIEAGSTETLLKLASDTIYLAMIKSQDFLTNPETKDFGEALESLTEAAIKQRFDGLTPTEITELSKFSQSGWPEAIQRWKESGFVDSDEWFDLVEADKDPAKFKSLQSKIKEKDLQLEQANTKLAEKETAKESKVETDFDSQGLTGLEKVLSEVVWKSSVLRDIAGDNAEMKEEKSILRDILLSDAAKELKSSATRENMLTAFKRGDANTKKFQTDFSSALNTAVLKTKEKTAVFERIVAKLYGQTRNGSLGKSKQPITTAPAAANESLVPTQTTQSAAKSQPTIASVEKGLEQAFAGL